MGFGGFIELLVAIATAGWMEFHGCLQAGAWGLVTLKLSAIGPIAPRYAGAPWRQIVFQVTPVTVDGHLQKYETKL
jgi:hypothetical protein